MTTPPAVPAAPSDLSPETKIPMPLWKRLNALRLEVEGSIVDDIVAHVSAALASEKAARERAEAEIASRQEVLNQRDAQLDATYARAVQAEAERDSIASLNEEMGRQRDAAIARAEEAERGNCACLFPGEPPPADCCDGPCPCCGAKPGEPCRHLKAANITASLLLDEQKARHAAEARAKIAERELQRTEECGDTGGVEECGQCLACLKDAAAAAERSLEEARGALRKLANGYEKCAAADEATAEHCLQNDDPVRIKAKVRADMNRRHAADLRALSAPEPGKGT